jgi:hypothetical protein
MNAQKAGEGVNSAPSSFYALPDIPFIDPTADKHRDTQRKVDPNQ